MKKIVVLSKIFLGAGLLLCTMNSCKNEPKKEDPKEVAEDQNEAKFENEDIEDDADYVVDAAEINTFEIEVGKLAQTKGVNQGVKDFGKMLVTDHTKSLEEIKTLASKKSITVPVSITDKGRDDYNKLNEKSGADFDEKFIDMMVDGHEKALDKMTKISQKATDSDITRWASNQVSTLTAHLDYAKKLKEMNDAK